MQEKIEEISELMNSLDKLIISLSYSYFIKDEPSSFKAKLECYRRNLQLLETKYREIEDKFKSTLLCIEQMEE